MTRLDLVPLTTQDSSLVDHASQLIVSRGEYGRHHIAAALRTTDGREFLGLHVSANFGRGSICAEAAAIAEALKQGLMEIETIAAIRHTFGSAQTLEVVPPCGACRELIMEYGFDGWVVLHTLQGLRRAKVRDLLPAPFSRRDITHNAPNEVGLKP